MDWGRAKSVLILAFLLLNMLLGYQLWMDVRERLQPNNTVAGLSPDTLAAMKSKGIELTGGIPKETPELQNLTYRYVDMDADEQNGDASGGEAQGGEITELQTPVDSRVVFDPKELSKALGGVIPEIGKYDLDTAVYDDRKFVLYRMAEGRPMFNVRLELYYSNQRITGYRQQRIELLPSEQQSPPQSVLPASKVIRTEIIERYVPEHAVIKEIRLGYKEGQLFDSETQVSTPSWRILMEDGSVIYLQAYSGEVLTDAAQPQPPSSPGTGK
ncbi:MULTISPECIES: two-component system regulatory protein YycI [Paenibacillus]|uniref:two-component system regulatory protein YycI n=1 Tax=Paenibacillus TaxID=44249 RepID=UPI000426175C|nr:MULTISPECIES: two-component system regulatory protein YycI [Paenibacillus]KKC48331.1 hypothetical protein VE23_16565 [Paenibacillus sp. D9]